jgi:ABC-2 type transport system permease protein
VRRREPARPRDDSAEPPRPPRLGLYATVSGFVRKTFTVTELEVRHLRHEPAELFTRAVQPALWLIIFGQVFTRVLPTGNLPYIDYLTPGILAQSVLFIAIFYGIAIIWERDLGIVNKFLASPTPRAALVLGKAFSAGVRALAQAVIIYVIAVLLRVNLAWNPLNLLGVVFFVVLGATIFSTFSLIVAALVRTREAFLGVGQLLTFPLFFASNAIYPIALMPHWLQAIALFNPLTYEVDALRALMLKNGVSVFGLGFDAILLLVVAVALDIIGGRLYPRVVS